ncbi:MAG: hydrogenase nickel incorporation protein HypB [Clostridia bacterium]|jgi:hydrogenase nickel incorporation protein HypB
MKIMMMKNVLSANQEIADKNRAEFKRKKITVLNIMASPGSGKTSVIINLIKLLGDKFPIYVIEGDIASSIDSEKIEELGIPVIQINTGGGCHLDANVIRTAVSNLGVKESAIVFIENVGNLICPSEFDLGEDFKIVIASVPEGDDKPYKYISMFEKADIVILNKIDLMPYINFKKVNFVKGIRALNKKAQIFEISCTTGEGLPELSEWISMNIE